jgi:hypothetical protein
LFFQHHQNPIIGEFKLNVDGVLGIFKIDKRGLCCQYCEFQQAKKKFDPQLIAGFFYAFSNFTRDFIGEGLQTLRTENYKVLIKRNPKFLNVIPSEVEGSV